MKTILMSNEAQMKILTECYSRNDNFETGGVLIGPKNHNRIITDILVSTEYAERSPFSYYQSATDCEVLNAQLREFQNNGYDFKGHFHKHPFDVNYFSGTDLKTFQKVLTSPNYRINNFLISCLVVNTITKEFPVLCYTMNLDESGELNINQVGIKVLPLKCIEECMDVFEPGEDHESDPTEHHCRATEIQEAGTDVWLHRSGRTDNMLPSKKRGFTGIGKFLSKGRQCWNFFKRKISSCIKRKSTEMLSH